MNNQPTLNAVKAGQAIPAKFSLGGDQSLDIFFAGYPLSHQIACDPGVPVDGIEESVTAGGTSLSYDATNDQYTYVSKTKKDWSGSCRRLVVKLDDETKHLADFKLK